MYLYCMGIVIIMCSTVRGQPLVSREALIVACSLSIVYAKHTICFFSASNWLLYRIVYLKRFHLPVYSIR